MGSLASILAKGTGKGKEVGVLSWATASDFCFPGPDVVCRWWSAAVAMAIGWLRGDDAAVRSHFAEVERMPKSLEMSECVGLLWLSKPRSF